MSENGYKITTASTMPGAAVSAGYRRDTRPTPNQALYALIAHLDDYRHFCGVQVVECGAVDENPEPWIRCVKKAEKELDAAISLHRNPQLAEILASGLRFEFKNPDDVVVIEVGPNR